MKPGTQHIIYKIVTMSPVPIWLRYGHVNIGQCHPMLAHKGLRNRRKHYLSDCLRLCVCSGVNSTSCDHGTSVTQTVTKQSLVPGQQRPEAEVGLS